MRSCSITASSEKNISYFTAEDAEIAEMGRSNLISARLACSAVQSEIAL
jgi:hypothetical protein